MCAPAESPASVIWSGSPPKLGAISLANLIAETASETSMYYDSARIPLYNENGKAVQAKQWLNGLRKYLKGMDVPSKVKTRGLGQAQLIVGE